MDKLQDRQRQGTLMVQGTSSDAGKSMLVAGLCRCLRRRNAKVVPFKPQNMALNSAVTAEGGEIGRAQAVQAQAAGIPPHVDMNPVLLKPNTDTGAQVIIHGKAVADMQAKAYHDYKTVAMNAVLASHGRLLIEYDVVVVEGAGSPAEINLRDRDIANMGFAEEVDCPVVLIADIDRGGVFAQLVGTLELLSRSEQDRIAGFVINKFRGDLGLLQPGLDWLEQRTGKPVLGVLPYLHHLQLAAEDAISAEQSLNPNDTRLKIAVPVFSRISNHTDFDMLRSLEQVELVFVPQHSDIPPCDLIILPGSKNVRDDLTLLRDMGWADGIARHLRYGGKLLGICGGFQMLGKSISDPDGVESAPGESEGLGYLNVHTRLTGQKQLTKDTGWFCLLEGHQPIPVTGYQIHAGRSHYAQDEDAFAMLDDQMSGQGSIRDGAISADGQVAGTYLHGLFDDVVALKHLLHWAGADVDIKESYHALQERELERLADACDAYLDWNKLDSILRK